MPWYNKNIAVNYVLKKSTVLPALMLICFISVVSGKADVQFSASVSESTIGVGDQFQISFTLSGSGRGFRPPPFGDFTVLMGPSQSSSTSIINGSISQSSTYTYILQAIKEGTFKIGSAEITVDGNKVLSNPVTISVVKGSQQPQHGNSSGGQGSQGNNPAGNLSSNVFLKAYADKTSLYLGEAMVVTYRLYTRVTLTNYSIDKLPSLTGFWSQEISLPQQLEFHMENLDGIQYKVADIKKMVVFPQRDGTLEIDPMQGDVVARVQMKRQPRSTDPFDPFANDPFFNQFFNNSVQDVKVPISSKAIRVTVKELPAGAPSSFKGAVGKFTFEASLDKDHTKTNEPVTLKIKIAGKGNVKLIDAPEITFPPDFETYDPKENSSVNATTAGVTGTKTFEYLIIPRNSGEYHIPVSPFSYFDLEKKQYVELKAPDIHVDVAKGTESAQSTGPASGIRQSDIKFLGKDIRYIKTRELNTISSGHPFFGSLLFYSLLGLPVVVFFGLVLMNRRKEHMLGNMALVKSQRANKVAMKRLATAKKYLGSSDQVKFLDEMFKALWGFVSDKLQIPVSDLSRETVARSLTEAKVPDALVTEFTSVLDSCEFARFGGGSGESSDSIYKKGFTVISSIENSIKS